MKKKQNKNIRKLTRTGSNRTLAVTLPADLIRAFGWREKQRLVIKKIVGGLTIRDARTKKAKKRKR